MARALLDPPIVVSDAGALTEAGAASVGVLTTTAAATGCGAVVADGAGLTTVAVAPASVLVPLPSPCPALRLSSDLVVADGAGVADLAVAAFGIFAVTAAAPAASAASVPPAAAIAAGGGVFVATFVVARFALFVPLWVTFELVVALGVAAVPLVASWFGVSLLFAMKAALCPFFAVRAGLAVLVAVGVGVGVVELASLVAMTTEAGLLPVVGIGRVLLAVFEVAVLVAAGAESAPFGAFEAGSGLGSALALVEFPEVAAAPLPAAGVC